MPGQVAVADRVIEAEPCTAVEGVALIHQRKQFSRPFLHFLFIGGARRAGRRKFEFRRDASAVFVQRKAGQRQADLVMHRHIVRRQLQAVS